MTAWTEFVKKVAARDGIAYGKALKVASAEYKKGDKAKAEKKPKAAGTKKGEARKGEPKGSRLAFDDTEQEMKKASKKK